jgi:hypothetical protein
MRKVVAFAIWCLAPIALLSQAQTATEIQQIQTQPKPAYCDEPPAMARSVVGGAPPIPRFPTLPTVCYKIQVAILRKNSPFEFRFHPSLVARWRPCEEVWVVESKETFCDRQEAERFRDNCKQMGYVDAFITQLVTYQ